MTVRTPALEDRLEARLRDEVARYEALSAQLADPEVVRDPERVRSVARERAAREALVDSARELERVRRELADARELRESADDPELRRLAAEEVERLEAVEGELVERVKELLVPGDPLEDRAAVLEIRAGTGGDEAGLFAADLMRMYQRLAERRGWRVELVSLSEGVLGGVKEAIFVVRGRRAYGELRFESGVHRVQRVPATESQGRIHTSAASVAVLPEADEVDVEIDSAELRIDVFRSSGPGGQSVNTTDSAVRVTHLPTGIVVTCQDEKSQHKNKARALKVLRSRLLDRLIAEREAERARERKLMIGTGDRSAKIRTYNFPQNRVTDHRIGLTLYRLAEILDGDLDELLEALRLEEQRERLATVGV
ncbi:MAG: peptide chain release factor 1 [Gemmatimonadetes bacterium]|nr:peptide chain release factor 1 [Gemmatimonadota bacterium]